MSGRHVAILDLVRPVPQFPVRGRLRVVDRRFQNDDGWWPWRGVSDFTAVYYVQNGREDLLAARFDAYAAVGRTLVRIFGNLNWPWFGISVDWRSAGYEAALLKTIQLANERGLYVELCCYGAAEFFANDMDYSMATELYATIAKAHPGVIIRLANEPYKNGWTNADDPRLLALADFTASILGHRDFAVGDAGDGNVPVLQTVAQHCHVALVHPDRTDDPNDARFRRWVDHLKSSAEMLEQLPATTAFVFDEPMGAGVRVYGKRDDDPDALLAAMLVSECLGVGYTYHWIAEEQAFAADALPGMTGFDAVRRDLPNDPAWAFSNSTPVATIEWAGKVGKTRNMIKDNSAWSVAYGEADWNSLTWNTGWFGSTRVAGPRIRVNEVVS